MKRYQYILLSVILALAPICVQAQMLQVIVASGSASGGGGSTVTYRSSADLGNNGGAAGDWTVSYTSGSGTNRMLLCGFLLAVGGSVSDSITGATYAGSAMTLAGKRVPLNFTSGYMYLFWMVAPATGANNVVVALSATENVSGACADYTGAKQTGQPDATVTNPTSNNTGSVANTLVTSITTVADNSMVVLFGQGYDGGNPLTAGTGSTRRAFYAGNACCISYALFDSGTPVTPAGSYSMTFNLAAAGIFAPGAVAASVSPAP